jgi:hypothetical protein
MMFLLFVFFVLFAFFVLSFVLPVIVVHFFLMNNDSFPLNHGDRLRRRQVARAYSHVGSHYIYADIHVACCGNACHANHTDKTADSTFHHLHLHVLSFLLAGFDQPGTSGIQCKKKPGCRKC